MTVLEEAQLAQWKTDLQSSNPNVAANAAVSCANAKAQADTTFRFTVYDQLWRPYGELGADLMDGSGTAPRNATPSAKLTIKGNSRWIPIFQQCRTTLVGVVVETGAMRWPYYVDTFDLTFEGGEWTGTVNLLGIWDILNYLVIWPEWYLPIQAQPLSHAVFVWALCTVCESMVAEPALRIQSGLWEFINNALSLNLDIRAWFGTLLQSNGNILEMLKTPIYVVRTNPFLDTSPLVARTVRMETVGDVIKDITRAYGVDVRVDLWLPGDEQPDEWTKAFSWLALDQPTYVVSVKDRQQISGPTKTVLDSVIGTTVDLAGSFVGEVGGLIREVPGMQGVFYSPLTGQSFSPPWAVLIAPEPGKDGGIVSCRITDHTPKGWQHIIGGRSPKWLNDLMNITFAWIIDSISILIGFSGIPSNLLEGFLNNAFLAFQLVELYDRRKAVGPYHPGIEVFHPTASSPYNIECVSGDTVIDGPDGKERIDVLAARGGPFQVWSITPDGQTVAATATLAFKKGRAELFQFTLADDRRISVTKDHRFLTDNDYIPAGELHVGSLIATIDGLQPITGIKSVGIDDFYDMHVPGWENYLAHGIWNHNTLFGFINAIWDSRGYTSAQVTFRNQEIYTLGVDIIPNQLMSVLYQGRTRLLTDFVENIMWRISPTERDVIIQIGDGKAEESPLAKHQRFITGVLETINTLTLAPQS